MTVNVNFKGGGSIIYDKPVFSPDGECVFVSWKNSLLEYSTKTGKLIHEFKGLTDRVAGFGYHIYDSYDCITACSISGQVIMWKAVTHFKIHEKKIERCNIQTFNIIPSQENEFIALITYKNEKQIHFAVADIDGKSVEDTGLELHLGYYRVDISGNNYFCVIQNSMMFFVKFKNTKKVYRSNIQLSNRKFTCIACHPSEEMVLTGDSSGRVVVWQNLTAIKRTQAVYHWHTLPVKCVAFSPAGTYFYSGGDECVLVKWRLENTQEKSFLPRIASTIQHIAVSNNNLFIALSTNDNAVRILDSRMNQISLIQHLVLGKQFSTGIVYDPRTKTLVMNGNIGQIQFYSPLDKSLLYNLDIVGQNKITNERNCSIENTEVRKIAISKCGFWLATVEERIDDKFHNELRLKFWKFIESLQTFELNTSIEYPHDKTITNILFQPVTNSTDLNCVTVSEEYKFKVWQLTEISTVYKKAFAWKCYSIGYYRNLPCRGLSFAVDGSLIAIGFGPILTTWLPDTCELKCSLVHPNYREDITHVEFGKGTDCHLIVSSSNGHVNVWNLLSLCLVWTVSINVSLLVADSLTTHMAIVSKNRKVVVFTPGSPSPLYTSKKLKKTQTIVTAGFVPSRYSNDARLNWSERSALYFVDCNNELFCLSNEEEPSYTTEDEDITDKSLYKMMMPEKQSSSVKSLMPYKHMYEKDNSHRDIKSYLDAPTHTMVPIRFMCGVLLNSLVLQKDKNLDENSV